MPFPQGSFSLFLPVVAHFACACSRIFRHSPWSSRQSKAGSPSVHDGLLLLWVSLGGLVQALVIFKTLEAIAFWQGGTA